MTRWTREMEDALADNCGLGAEGLRRMLLRDFGARVSTAAVERKCYRLGISPRLGIDAGDGMVCDRCGRHFRRGTRGRTTCPECLAMARRERQLAIGEEIAAGERRARDIDREAARLKKRNQRSRGRNGNCGDSV